jgi:mercuric ion transport protein
LLLRLSELWVWLHAWEPVLRELLRGVDRRGTREQPRPGEGGLTRPARAAADMVVGPRRRHTLLGYLGLFASVGTLLCCALPSMLVLLGLGATVASVLTSVPWLVAVSRYKEWVFATSALLIASNFYYVYSLAPRLLARRGACAADDPTCARATRVSRAVLWTSVLLLLIGFTVAYALPIVLQLADA